MIYKFCQLGDRIQNSDNYIKNLRYVFRFSNPTISDWDNNFKFMGKGFHVAKKYSITFKLRIITKDNIFNS